MTVTAAIQVNQILTRVGVEVGLAEVTDPFGSQLQHYIQMKYLLQTCGEELCLAFPWEFLVRTLEITTDGTDEYDLPADFQSMIDQTGWDLTNEFPVRGPLTAQEFELLKATQTLATNVFGYRIMGGKLVVYPTPPAGFDLTFEYQSRSFVRTDAVPAVYQPSFTAGSDYILFDRTLITRYLKCKWLEAKGFDNSAALMTFNQTFEFLTGKDKGGAILNAGRSRGFPYLGYRNIPETGYGQ